ncbi:MAG: serine/threonine protein kinase [Mediterranea sp.]|jgi:serine/threonine protein kinase|nr:serine/threonine protein kinase [Mediterranea sp.]
MEADFYVSEKTSYRSFKERYSYGEADFLGGGRYGKVYKARDTKQRGKLVAIKEPTEEATRKYRLRNEIAAVMGLPEHNNIVTYIDYYTFVEEGKEKDYIVMRYYEDGDLYHLARRRVLSDAEKESILLGILDGLDFLHSHGLIHRDLKPANILISHQGERYIPKIGDFGISKEIDADNDEAPNSELGTLLYSSREQRLGDPVKPNTDLWNFGIIAYELFTGNIPKYWREAVVNIDRIPERWRRLVLRCLVEDPKERARDVGECLRLLSASPQEEEYEEEEDDMRTIQRRDEEYDEEIVEVLEVVPDAEVVEVLEEAPDDEYEPPVETIPRDNWKKEPESAPAGIVDEAKRQLQMPPSFVDILRDRWKEVIAAILLAAAVLFVANMCSSPPSSSVAKGGKTLKTGTVNRR